MHSGGYERLPMYSKTSKPNGVRLRSHTNPQSPAPPRINAPVSIRRGESTASSRWTLRIPTVTQLLRPSRMSWITPQAIMAVLKIVLPLLVFGLLAFIYIYETHIELQFYLRGWIRRQVTDMEPLSGCFEPQRVSPAYNVSENIYGPKRVDVQAGMAMTLGMDCYDFAGTIRSDPSRPRPHVLLQDRTLYHSYWRKDLAPFGPRQEWMLKSFFATQDISATRFVLWSNGDLSDNPILASYQRRFPEAFAMKTIDVANLAQGTSLEGSALLKSTDSRAWTDGDLIRLLLLWAYGGVWIDMDSLLTRDLEPLLEHEFITRWDCYGRSSSTLYNAFNTRAEDLLSDKPYLALNGALMRFKKHSPYLCEAFHIMSTSEPPRPGSTDWGALLYLKLWRRLVAAGIPPYKILPFCFSDGRSCRLDNRLPDPFVPDHKSGKWSMGLGLEEGGGLDIALSKIFAVHLHGQWERIYPPGGWVDRLLLTRYDSKLASAAR